MQLFNVKIRLSGSVQNEVRRFGVTAPEIIALRAEHGENEVSEIERAGEVDRRNDQERARLEALFGEAKIEKLFGAKYGELPKTIPGVNEAELPKAGIQRVTGAEVDKAKKAGGKATAADLAA